MRVNFDDVERELGLRQGLSPRELAIVLGVLAGICLPLVALMAPFWPLGSREAFATAVVASLGLGVALGALRGGERKVTQTEVTIDPLHPDGIVLGVDQHGEEVVFPTKVQSQHMLVVGAPGMGKSQFLSNLAHSKVLRTAHRRAALKRVVTGGAVVALDAKPEDSSLRLHMYTAFMDPERRTRFRALIPDKPHWSSTFNPLRQHGSVEEQVSLLTGLKKFDSTASNEYYGSQQEDVMAGIIGALVGTGRDYHMGDVLAALSSSSARERLMSWPNNDGARQLAMTLQGYQNRDGFDSKRFWYEQGGLAVVLRRYLRTAGPILLHERGEIDMYSILKEGGYLYLALPTASKEGYAWALLMMKCMSSAVGKLIREGFKPDEPNLCLGDEFAAWCNEDAAFAMATWRAGFTGLVCFFQSASQLDTPHTRSLQQKVMDNTYFKVFFGATGAAGAETAAEQIGEEMQIHRSFNLANSRGRSAAMGRSSKSQNENAGIGGREALAYKVQPDELRNLTVGTAFVQWRGNHAKVKTPFLQVPEEELPPLPEPHEKRKVAGEFPRKTSKGIGLWKDFQRDVDHNIGRYQSPEG